MKRWAFFTVLIYLAALLLLTFPVVYAAFAGKTFSVQQAADTYFYWGYWLWLAVLIGGQVLLLLVPIDLSERRLPSRRKLKVPVIVGAFFLSSLFLAGLVSLLCAIFRDNGLDVFDIAGIVYLDFQRPEPRPGSSSSTVQPVARTQHVVAAARLLVRLGILFSGAPRRGTMTRTR